MTEKGLYVEGNEDGGKIRKIAGYGHIGDGKSVIASSSILRSFSRLIVCRVEREKEEKECVESNRT